MKMTAKIVAAAVVAALAGAPVAIKAQSPQDAGTAASSQTPIRDSVGRYASHPEIALTTNLTSAANAQGSTQQKKGMSKGKKAAIIAILAGAAVISYAISQKGNKRGTKSEEVNPLIFLFPF
jgi:hypothetical protein